jgi:hypothetical protein
MEKRMYPVCPHRNVAAAFECFFGPDSRSLDRFLEVQRMRRTAEVMRRTAEAVARARAQGRRARAGAVRGLKSGALVISKAVADLNLLLNLGWIAAFYAFSALAWAAKFLLYQARLWLPRGWRRGNDAVAVLGRWAARYRLPLKKALRVRLARLGWHDSDLAT